MANRFMSQRNFLSWCRCNQGALQIEAKGRGFKKAFVCSDPDLVKFGVTKKVIRRTWTALVLTYELYSNIKPNPTIENVQTGVEAFKKLPVLITSIAIGGGSSMDTAKGHRYYHCKP